MKKFRKSKTNTKWPKEKTLDKIKETEEALGELQKLINEHNVVISIAKERIRVHANRMSDRQRYLDQLKEQLENDNESKKL